MDAPFGKDIHLQKKKKKIGKKTTLDTLDTYRDCIRPTQEAKYHLVPGKPWAALQKEDLFIPGQIGVRSLWKLSMCTTKLYIDH